MNDSCLHMQALLLSAETDDDAWVIVGFVRRYYPEFLAAFIAQCESIILERYGRENG